jgi:hypothetical protein
MKKKLTVMLLGAAAVAAPLVGAGHTGAHRHPAHEIAGSKPGVGSGANALYAGSKPGIGSGANALYAGSKPGIGSGANILYVGSKPGIAGGDNYVAV